MESADRPQEAASSHKRKRSASITNNNIHPPPNAPVAKAAKVAGNQLSINYIARSSNEDLPLIHKDETLPNLLHLLSLYTSVLDRHESLASNLGARPLGPILIKRFERCFDAPPKIVASHQKSAAGSDDGSHRITWLEVIEFARSHPLQFTLGAFSEGRRVCQFYHPQRQLRVQITEEDFLFIKSGRCQELIPPLPIWEDEEKEVSTCDVLEARLKELTNAADMVAARTRQLSHRLKGRRTAILERRAEGGSGTPARVNAQQTTTAPPSAGAGIGATSSAAGAGSTAVHINGSASGAEDGAGHAISVRNELLRHFESLPQNQHHNKPQATQSSDLEALHGFRSYEVPVPEQRLTAASNPASKSPNPVSPSHHDQPSEPTDTQPQDLSTTTNQGLGSSSGANGATKHNFSRPLPPALESSQPYRPLCQAHMDSLPRGYRVLPPCDRCRRLRMDCVKNLTSCAGCTKKHARCHWRDVSRDELASLDHLIDTSAYSAHSPAASDGQSNGLRGHNEAGGTHESDDDDDDESNPLEDLEVLGEQEEKERQKGPERQQQQQQQQQQHESASSAPTAPTWNDSLPKSDVPGGSHAVRPDLGPPDVAQTSRIRLSTHVYGDISDASRLPATTSSTAATTLVNPSYAPRKSVSDKHLDGSRRTGTDSLVVGPTASRSAGNADEHDIQPPPLAGIDGSTSPRTGGFRAVNTSIPSTKVQH